MVLNLSDLQIQIFVVDFVECGWFGLLSFIAIRSRSSGPQRTLRERVKGTSRATAKIQRWKAGIEQWDAPVLLQALIYSQSNVMEKPQVSGLE